MEPAIYTAKSYVPERTVVLFSNLSRTIRFSFPEDPQSPGFQDDP